MCFDCVPPFLIPEVVYFKGEVPVVCVSLLCDSVVVSEDFFD